MVLTPLATGLMLVVYTPDYSEDRAGLVASIAEATVITERCKIAHLDHEAVVRLSLEAGVDLLNDNELRQYYLFQLQNVRDRMWNRGDMAVCDLGWLFYGPKGLPDTRILIFDRPPP